MIWDLVVIVWLLGRCDFGFGCWVGGAVFRLRASYFAAAVLVWCLRSSLVVCWIGVSGGVWFWMGVMVAWRGFVVFLCYTF